MKPPFLSLLERICWAALQMILYRFKLSCREDLFSSIAAYVKHSLLFPNCVEAYFYTFLSMDIFKLSFMVSVLEIIFK